MNQLTQPLATVQIGITLVEILESIGYASAHFF
jgi:hypothetical protein